MSRFVEAFKAAIGGTNIHKITMEFDGSGDDGAVQDAQAFDAGNNPVPLPRYLQAIAEDLLFERLPSGWENNDGSSGEVLIDREGNVTGQIHWNVMTQETEEI